MELIIAVSKKGGGGEEKENYYKSILIQSYQTWVDLQFKIIHNT